MLTRFSLESTGAWAFPQPPGNHHLCRRRKAHPSRWRGVYLPEDQARMLRGTLAPERTIESPYQHWYPTAKRAMDLALCIAILPLAIPVMLMISMLILIDSGGPIFFVQERVGRNRRVFRMYKFRTLKPGYDARLGREFMQAFVRGQTGLADGDGGRRIYKPIGQSQVTRVGRVLRRTSLDELPQIFNVLRGEMSLVGPRPYIPWEVEAFRDWHYERLKVLPGITGLAQVRGRSGISFDEIVRHDIEYIRKQSLKLDLRILGWTLLSVLGGRGVR